MTDLEILARIVQCEAGGEGEQGMKAVACVVMNRVHVDYGEYGRLATIREVIYQTASLTVPGRPFEASTTPRIFTTCPWRTSTTTLRSGP